MNSETRRVYSAEAMTMNKFYIFCDDDDDDSFGPGKGINYLSGLTQLLIRMVLESVNFRGCHLLNAHDNLSPLLLLVLRKTPSHVSIHGAVLMM